MHEQRWVGDVLGFWFEELERTDWFRKDEKTDASIRSRFLSIYEDVSMQPVPSLSADPETALAAAIVLDQFPRNLFRGSPRAFATDERARDIAKAAIGKGFDAKLPLDRRLFLYLPFEHSERAEDQERSVSLIASLGDQEFTRYARAHADVIARFGRFPHRNTSLGRLSTPEEDAYLKEPGSGF